MQDWKWSERVEDTQKNINWTRTHFQTPNKARTNRSRVMRSFFYKLVGVCTIFLKFSVKCRLLCREAVIGWSAKMRYVSEISHIERISLKPVWNVTTLQKNGSYSKTKSMNNKRKMQTRLVIIFHSHFSSSTSASNSYRIACNGRERPAFHRCILALLA